MTETPTDPDALRAEIEYTRHQLAETVAALAAKTDVKSRVKDSMMSMSGQVKHRAQEVAGQAGDLVGTVGHKVSDFGQLIVTNASNMTRSIHRGGHRAHDGGTHRADAAWPEELTPGRRVDAWYLAVGAAGGALVGLVAWLIWHGRR